MQYVTVTDTLKSTLRSSLLAKMNRQTPQQNVVALKAFEALGDSLLEFARKTDDDKKRSNLFSTASRVFNKVSELLLCLPYDSDIYSAIGERISSKGMFALKAEETYIRYEIVLDNLSKATMLLDSNSTSDGHSALNIFADSINQLIDLSDKKNPIRIHSIPVLLKELRSKHSDLKYGLALNLVAQADALMIIGCESDLLLATRKYALAMRELRDVRTVDLPKEVDQSIAYLLPKLTRKLREIREKLCVSITTSNLESFSQQPQQPEAR